MDKAVGLFLTHLSLLFQAFVRDPDGYYIEFCTCENLEIYLRAAMEKNNQHMNSLTALISTKKFSHKLMGKAIKSKKSVEELRFKGKKVLYETSVNHWSLQVVS